MYGWIILGTLAFLLLLAFLTVYICFYRIFLTHRKPPSDKIALPDGEEYRPHHERILNWVKDMRGLPCTEFSTVSFDGLTLYAKYYEYGNNKLEQAAKQYWEQVKGK